MQAARRKLQINKLLAALACALFILLPAQSAAGQPSLEITVSSQSKDHISVSWTDLGDVLLYFVEIRGNGHYDFTTVNAGTTAHTFGGLKADATYTIKMTAYPESGGALVADIQAQTVAPSPTAAASNTPTATPTSTHTATPRTAPSATATLPAFSISVSSQSKDHITVAWTDLSAALDYSLTLQPESGSKTTATAAAGSTSHTFGSLNSNATYTVSVTARFSDGRTLSASVTTKTEPEATATPTATSIPTATSTSTQSPGTHPTSTSAGKVYKTINRYDKVRIQWDHIINDVETDLTPVYRLYRSPVGLKGWEGTIITYRWYEYEYTAAQGMKPDTEYKIWVTVADQWCRRKTCDGKPLASLDVFTFRSPPKPTETPTATLPAFNISVSKQSKDHITVAWTDLSAALDYSLTLQPESGSNTTATVAAGTTSHTFGGLNSNATYTVSITARFSDGRTLSASVTTKTEPEATATPTATATSTSAQVSLNGSRCELDDAINAANSDAASGSCPAGDGVDTITFHGDVILSGSLSPPSIASDIIIQGGGHTLSRLSKKGMARFRLLNIHSGTVVIHKLTLTKGYVASYGGAIYNNGTLSIDTSTFRNNETSYYGGAIFNGGTLTISNSTFSGNETSHRGGAIHNQGDLTISGSSFSENEASHKGGAIYHGSRNARDEEGFGQWIGVDRAGSLTVKHSSFTKNSVSQTGSAILYVGDLSKLSISGSSFSGNTASHDNGPVWCVAHSMGAQTNAACDNIEYEKVDATATPAATFTPTPTPLPAFSISVSKQSKDHITVAWTDLSAALDYTLTLQPESGKKRSKTVAAGRTSHTYGGLNSNATYTISITARFSDGTTRTASVTTKTEPEATATPSATPCRIQGRIEVLGVSKDHITVRWPNYQTGKAYGTSYLYNVVLRGGGIVNQRSLSSIYTTRTFAGLQEDTVYDITVTTTEMANGCISTSQTSVRTAATNVWIKVDNVTTDSITLEWSRVNTAWSYRLRVRGEDYSVAIAPSKLFYTFPGLTPDTEYTVDITVYLDDGPPKSEHMDPTQTASVSARTAADPNYQSPTPVPTNVITPQVNLSTSDLTHDSITVNWDWNGSPEVTSPPQLQMIDTNQRMVIHTAHAIDNKGSYAFTGLDANTKHSISFVVFPKSGKDKVLTLGYVEAFTSAEPTDTPKTPTATQSALPKLPAPQNLRVLSGNTVAWDAVAGADRYRVRLDPPVGERILKRVDPPQTQFTFEDVQPGTVYTVRVRAMGDEVVYRLLGDWSQSLSLTAAATSTPVPSDTPTATPLPPQVSLSASAVTHNSITVSWNWNGSPEVRVPPQIALDDNHNHYGADALDNAGSIVFTDLEPNTLHTYSFTVFPKNGGAGLKLSSGQVRTLSRPTATPVPPTASPLPPIKMTWSIVAVNGKAEAILRWSAVSGVSSYTLQYAGSDLSSGSFSLLASATSQRISGLNPGAVYQVTLTANLQDGSTHTGAAHFTINIPPTDTPIPTNTPVPTATPLPTNTPVPPSPTATPLPSLIQTLIGYRDEQPSSSDHYKRWTRALAALGHGSHNNPMTLQEAKNMADKYMRSRWQPVVDALEQAQSSHQQDQQATAVPPTNTPVPPTNTPIPPTNTPIPPTNTPVPPPTNTPIPPPTNTPVPPPTNTPVPPPTDTPVPQSYTVPQSLIDTLIGYTQENYGDAHVKRWKRALTALGHDSGEGAMTLQEAKDMADTYSRNRWQPVIDALEKLAGE